MLLKNTQNLHNCMRNEQFATARQSLYGQIQLGERVSTHKISSPLKRFRASWVSTRQWTSTVLNSSMNLSSSSALSLHKWEVSTEQLNLAARFENWSICIDTASISTSSHFSAGWQCDSFPASGWGFRVDDVFWRFTAFMWPWHILYLGKSGVAKALDCSSFGKFS